MPPKAAEKKPTTGGKAPAGKAPAEKKEAGKKTAAPAGDKKKRNKTRKETYSSYIYKGAIPDFVLILEARLDPIASTSKSSQQLGLPSLVKSFPLESILTRPISSPQTGSP